MDKHVRPKAALVLEAGIADLAAVRLLVCVGDHMYIKTSFPCELRTTNSADVLLLIRVQQHVSLQAGTPRKLGIADFTAMFLCPSVAGMVLPEEGTSLEHSTTHCALMWSPLTMHSHVLFQILLL